MNEGSNVETRDERLKFEWDERKNQLNIKKHNISFEEAETVFQDANAVYVYDEQNSIDEDRFNVIGLIDSINHEIVVCHCYRGDNDNIIRIISARKANQTEVRLYREGL